MLRYFLPPPKRTARGIDTSSYFGSRHRTLRPAVLCYEHQHICVMTLLQDAIDGCIEEPRCMRPVRVIACMSDQEKGQPAISPASPSGSATKMVGLSSVATARTSASKPRDVAIRNS